tara:strand:+ start:1059 stop:1556 length:498 start_codon:yes stop_codon:yes gene_type:complete
MKKIILLASTLFLASPVMSAEITSRIVDSIQLTVEGPAVQSTRIGSNYAVSGSNITATTLGGLTGSTATAPATISAGTYEVTTDGQAFTFSESQIVGDTVVTSQTALSGGQTTTPNIYGETITSQGGTAGTLAGTLSPTGIPTITAGGAGSTGIGQRTVELSVFN